MKYFRLRDNSEQQENFNQKLKKRKYENSPSQQNKKCRVQI